MKWKDVCDDLRLRANSTSLYDGQANSLHAIADRIADNGLIIADEVGMGKTRIASHLAHSVAKAGGRVAILIPPGLSFQWKSELRIVDKAPVNFVRSFQDFMKPWPNPDWRKKPDATEPHHLQPILLLSHLFANWRLTENTERRPSGLVSVVHRVLKNDGKAIKGGEDYGVFDAAKIIAELASLDKTIDTNEFLEFQYEHVKDGLRYAAGTDQRRWLESIVGCGFGSFDLVIIDEAHKNRDDEGGLARLLDNVIHPSRNCRFVGLSATPVELSADQWWQTLGRVRVSKEAVLRKAQVVENPIDQYARSLAKVRQLWQTSGEARRDFKNASANFQKALSPFLIRRDKREDKLLKEFADRSGLDFGDYRHVQEIKVKLSDLSESWLKAVCAAESLSAAARMNTNSKAQRARLTIGSGHGIATLLDHSKRTKEDAAEGFGSPTDGAIVEKKSQRDDRVAAWLEVIESAFNDGDQSLYEHPALKACIEKVDEKTKAGEKVLIFGRFNKPLRALTHLLDAREMIRALAQDRYWPQKQVPKGEGDQSRWSAVEAAYNGLRKKELKLPPFERRWVSDRLKEQYNKFESAREKFRSHLISNLRSELVEGSLAREVLERIAVEIIGDHKLLLRLSRALYTLSESREEKKPSADIAKTFQDLLLTVVDDDDANADGDSKQSVAEKNKNFQASAEAAYKSLSVRLEEDFDNPEGGFARHMFGSTSPQSRRYLQLAFNRQESYPRVLVAQSAVAREGLDLHKACRNVILLHPEWNPAMVEQQIGRVDRYDSAWARDFRAAVDNGESPAKLPRIDVYMVIFEGTYDEHNWNVMRGRWADLRAQLHGIVLDRSHLKDQTFAAAFDETNNCAPKFYPPSRRKSK